MTLPGDLPQRQILRMCKFCKFYRPGNNSDAGICNLAKLSDSTNDDRPTHATLTCSAHVWKKPLFVQTLQIKYDAELQE